MVQYLLSLPDIDVNAGNYIGQTALIFAAYHGQLELVQHLVEHGGNINSIDDDGKLPWIIMCCHGLLWVTMPSWNSIDWDGYLRVTMSYLRLP